MAASRDIDGGWYNNTYDCWEWTDDNGKPHRDGDKPALIYPRFGSQIFCRHGKYEKLVRRDGLEYSLEGGTWQDGLWVWYDENGDLHRDGDDPAIIWYGGTAAWYHHGEQHRLTGPAFVLASGRRPNWYINGKKFKSQEKFEAARTLYCEEHDIPVPGRQTKRATPT